MIGWTVVDRKSNRHKWNLICTTVDPLYRDLVVVNQLDKLAQWEKGEGYQVGYFRVDNYTGGSIDTCTWSQTTKMDLDLTVGDELPEPISFVREMRNSNYKFHEAREALTVKGFDYSTDYPTEGK